MLACNACIRKTICIFLADVVDYTIPYLHGPQRHRFIASPPKPPQSWAARRTLASSAEAVPPGPGPERDSVTLMPRYTKHKQKAMTARLSFNQKNLREELRYLGDPLKLADHVKSLLQRDGFNKAVELVRMAGTSVSCTVSWNHLIDHEMCQGRVNGALKLYHEMKKRAQLPDSRTFTILFRGFADHPRYAQSLHRALSIYQSMFAEKSPVKPSIIHTNAVLNVCARALDVDALLGVAAKLPTRGVTAPNEVTFTTIINAMRTATLKKGETTSFGRRWEIWQTATNQGRRIWGEIRDRWQNRDIQVDEDLVCAMGRLLLLGSTNQDYDDVLSLVEQTMGIPRQVSRLENGNDKVVSDQRSKYGQATELTSKPEQSEAEGWPAEELEELKNLMALRLSSGVVESENEEDVLGYEFDAVDSRKINYAHPGCNTLSMVVDACISLKALRAAQDYWGLLTDPDGEYKINPDAENYHVYLRLLRMKRASKLSVELLEELCYKRLGGTNILQSKTFRIGLSTCLRDVNNPNVLNHANKMARIMLDTLEKPDVRALGIYLRIALTDQHCHWKSLMGVLRGCEIGVRNLHSYLMYGMQSGRTDEKRDLEEEAIKFVTKLARAFQTAMSLGRGQMSSEEEKFCKVQRGKMSDWVKRMRKMGRGKERWEEQHNQGAGEENEEDEEDDENNQRRSSDEVTKAEGSIKRVDGVDSGKVQDGRSRWTLRRQNIKADRLKKPVEVPSTPKPTSSEKEEKRFPRPTYRPTSIHFYRKSLTHQSRMRARSHQARQTLRKKAQELEQW